MAKTPDKQTMQPDAKSVIAVSSSPFGDAEVGASDPEHFDLFYVDGYAQERRRFEHEARNGGRATPMPYRLQYVTTMGPQGKLSNAKVAYYRARGYTPVLYDEAKEKYQIDPALSGFSKDADGTCAVGSQILMACPREKVAHHVKQLNDTNAALSGRPLASAKAAASEFNARMGLSRDGGTSFELDETEFKAPR